MLERLANVIYWFFSGISGLSGLWGVSYLFPEKPKGLSELPEGFVLDPTPTVSTNFVLVHNPIDWTNIGIAIFIAIISYLSGRAIKYILAGK